MRGFSRWLVGAGRRAGFVALCVLSGIAPVSCGPAVPPATSGATQSTGSHRVASTAGRAESAAAVPGLAAARDASGSTTAGVTQDEDTGGPAGSVAQPAQRIVTLAPHLAELVFTAGAGDQLVGVVAYSDFPQAARALPRIGDAYRIDFEVLAGLAPDLVIAWGGGTPAQVRERLRSLGYRVYVSEADELAGIGRELRAIGRLAGTKGVANAAADRFDARLENLRRRYAGAPEVRVFYQVSAQPLFTVSGHHVISEAIEVCGGENIFANMGGLSPAVTLESVIAAAPDAIVAGASAARPDARRALAEQWSRWPSIPAVAHGGLITVNADEISRPATRMLDAIADLCRQLDDRRGRTGARHQNQKNIESRQM